jgi:hypothetical protein
MKIPKDIIGNPTRDISACRAVPQPVSTGVNKTLIATRNLKHEQ